MPSVLITGASRGLGLEFARQYAADGWDVIAGCRNPDAATELRATGARPVRLDVTREDDLAGLADALPAGMLDVLICNAGVIGPRTSGIAAFSDAEFDLVMHTNVAGPLRTIAALADVLTAGHGRIALLSSRMGSVGQAAHADRPLYRISKAAANMVGRLAALEYGPRGLTTLVFHPGWVRTDMGGAGAALDASESVTGMRKVIAAATIADNGRFVLWNGEEWAW
jgi:NAD(P)-dependent dehydrogenase (short-subunit alcohol dehydrogenase family)